MLVAALQERFCTQNMLVSSDIKQQGLIKPLSCDGQPAAADLTVCAQQPCCSTPKHVDSQNLFGLTAIAHVQLDCTLTQEMSTNTNAADVQPQMVAATHYLESCTPACTDTHCNAHSAPLNAMPMHNTSSVVTRMCPCFFDLFGKHRLSLLLLSEVVAERHSIAT